jgi:hypothetical protein
MAIMKSRHFFLMVKGSGPASGFGVRMGRIPILNWTFSSQPGASFSMPTAMYLVSGTNPIRPVSAAGVM